MSYSKALIVISFVLLSPMHVLAENNLDIVNACLSALKSGDIEAAKQKADIVKEWKNIKYTPFKTSGAKCLSGVFAEQYTYSNKQRRFLNAAEHEIENAKKLKSMEYQMKKTEERAEQERARTKLDELLRQQRLANKQREIKRKAEVIRLVKEVCEAKFHSDYKEAITNTICFNNFLEFGLPTQ